MDINILLPVISAIGGGIIGGIVSPFVKWYIELKKLKREERRLFINDVRGYLIKASGQDLDEISTKVFYSRLRQYLTKKLIKRIEWHTNTIDIVENYKRDGILHQILDEIAELEKKWNLI